MHYQIGMGGAFMTSRAVAALQADRDALIGLCRSLDADQWAARSGWSGWSVQGLVTHLAGGFWRIVDPAGLPDTSDLSLEAAQDAVVASRAHRSSDEVVEDYVEISGRALGQLARAQGHDQVISYGALGRFPASMSPNSFGFDHFAHIRFDLCAPRGPLAVEPPPCDELRLVPALDWIEAALPQQNAELLESMTGSVVIDVTGIGARTFTAGSGPPAVTITTDAVSLIQWVTQRFDWSGLAIDAAGDPADLDRTGKLAVR
jgi:uncharacterized protein (TIGR03083 family)